jgi:hypothetical protein
MLLYDICKALSEAAIEATTHELVMVASAACAKQCIQLTAAVTVTEPQATSSSTTAATTTYTVSDKMMLQCLERLTVCIATATASAFSTTPVSAAAAAVLRAAITLLTVHACSSSTVTATTGSTQLSLQEQTALRTSLLHMYDRIPSSGIASTAVTTTTMSAAVAELQNSTGVVIAGARMLVSALHCTVSSHLCMSLYACLFL